MLTEILVLLKQQNGFVSGEQLSRNLGISRAAVWKYIETLRADGYELEAVSRQGYRLTKTPDRVYPAEIAYGLKTAEFGRKVMYFDTTSSTMDEAIRLAMDGAAQGTLVIAEGQTKGRGRLGRSWVSPKGRGLYFSLILRPDFPPQEAARLTLLIAVCVSEAIEETTGLRPLIKWPNDLLLEGKKICGVLTEMNAEMDRIRFLVAGIGINVNSSESQLADRATSLKAIGGKTYDRAAILRCVLEKIERRYIDLKVTGFEETLDAWKKRSATLGRAVNFRLGNRALSGKAVGLADDGGLLVKLPDGKEVKVISGDVTI